MPIIHRITEWSNLEGIFGSHLLQPLCSNGVTQSQLPRTYPDGFWISLRVATPWSLQATCSICSWKEMDENFELCSFFFFLCPFFLTGLTKVHLTSVNHQLLLSLFFFMFNWYWWLNSLKVQGKLILVNFTSSLKILVSEEGTLSPIT